MNEWYFRLLHMLYGNGVNFSRFFRPVSLHFDQPKCFRIHLKNITQFLPQIQTWKRTASFPAAYRLGITPNFFGDLCL
ncbi:hypothetical protein KDA_55310 [Dictyobacter alpinus]|uniref:Uncharacterized protein n=1 Tax=Dictyobacter alpinus TaxID=2014873 RepID=A0A402BFK7_9CHLR|nr:hypothetical protein KDA_55310 [Dictyobacter alpinus]